MSFTSASRVFTIDGRHLISGIHGGVQRYLSEILTELDQIAQPGDYEICIPEGSAIPEEYHNIPVVQYGKLNGLLWEQISLPIYLRKHHRYGIFPCSVVPFAYCKGIAIIHDIMVKTVPMVARSLNPFLRLAIRSNFSVAARKASLIGTVSTYSKKEIFETYNLNPAKIIVISSAWQHFSRIDADNSWMKNHPEVISGQFYFSLSANRIQKNFRWIYEVARRNPESIFVIAGTQEEWQKQIEYSAENVIYLGDVTDGVIRSLMENCKAFLFPSLYEGFGLPPLEALSAGAPIVIARSSCLPEVYGEAAHYIDPYDYEVDLERILSEPVASPESALNKYSWKKSAEQLDIARKRIIQHDLQK